MSKLTGGSILTESSCISGRSWWVVACKAPSVWVPRWTAAGAPPAAKVAEASSSARASRMVDACDRGQLSKVGWARRVTLSQAPRAINYCGNDASTDDRAQRALPRRVAHLLLRFLRQGVAMGASFLAQTQPGERRVPEARMAHTKRRTETASWAPRTARSHARCCTLGLSWTAWQPRP